MRALSADKPSDTVGRPGGLAAIAVLLGLLFTMMVRLRNEMDKVRQSHDDVEVQVAERTQQVVEKQQQLIQTAKLASLGNVRRCGT